MLTVTVAQAQTDLLTAQTNLDLAVSSYSTTMDGISTGLQTAINSHRTTMEGNVAGFVGSYDTAIAGIEGPLQTSLDGLRISYEGTLDAFRGTYDGAVTSAATTWSGSTGTAFGAYETAELGIESALDTAIGSAFVGYQGTETIQRGILDGVIGSEDANLQGDISTEFLNFSATQTTQRGIFDSAEDGFSTAYQTAIGSALGGFQWTYNNAVTGYETARDAVLSANTNISLDPQAIFFDPGFQALIGPINSSHGSNLSGFHSTFEGDLQSNATAYQNAVYGPGGLMIAYSSSVAGADTILAGRYTSAQDLYNTNMAPAYSNYNSAIYGPGGYQPTFDNALISARGTFDGSIVAVDAEYHAIVDPAKGTYESAVQSAVDGYNNWLTTNLTGVTTATEVWNETYFDTVTLKTTFFTKYRHTASTGDVVEWYSKTPGTYGLKCDSGIPTPTVSTSVSGSVNATIKYYSSLTDPNLDLAYRPEVAAAVAGMPDRNVYEHAILEATAAYLDSLQSLELNLQNSIQSLTPIHDTQVAAANQDYEDARWIDPVTLGPGFETVYNSALAGDQSIFDGAAQTANTNYWAAINGPTNPYPAYMAAMMSMNPAAMATASANYQSFLGTTNKQYAVDIANAQVDFAVSSSSDWTIYVAAERAADTIRDQAIHDADWQRNDATVVMVSNTANSEVVATGGYLQGLIQTMSQYENAAAAKTTDVISQIGLAGKNFQLTEHGARESSNNLANAAGRQYGYDYAALETLRNNEASASQTLWQASADEQQTYDNDIADAERDWVWSVKGFADTLAPQVSSLWVSEDGSNLSDYVSYVGNVSGERVSWTSDFGNAFYNYVTTGSTDVGLLAAANAWRQFWNDSASAGQSFANSSAGAYQTFGNSTVGAAKTASDNIALDGSTHSGNIADQSVNWMTNVALAAHGFEFAMAGAMVTEVSQAATGQRTALEDDSDARETRGNAR